MYIPMTNAQQKNVKGAETETEAEAETETEA